MNFWNQMPLFRLLLSFTAGILLAIYCDFKDNFNILFWLTFFLLLLLFVITFLKKIYSSYRFRWSYGVVITVMMLVLGYRFTLLKTEKNAPEHFSNIRSDAATALAYIDEPLKEKNNSFKTVLRIFAMNEQEKQHNTTGKILVYFAKDTLSERLKYGDVILLGTKGFKEVHPPQNPSEFNYKRYLSFHSVHHQAYLKNTDWKKLDEQKGNALVSFSLSVRELLLELFRQNGISGDEYAVISALILGYTDEIDAGLIGAYSSAGAMHILSVSGLHVGIIYIVINALLFFLDKNKGTRILKAFILLIFLWGYALLTGLSPAVLRAAAMLSFVVTGKALDRHTNIYNTLAASAFVLLLFNPYLIMEVGFQLSYLAVLGIVMLHPKIYELWEAPNRLAEQIWSIISVSIAAQLATFPLGLLYFHQFPNYFLVSNLLVIPLSTLIIYGGILLLCLSSFPVVALLIGKAESFLVYLMNLIVTSVENLPFSMLKGISVTVTETWTMYLITGFMLAYIFTVRVRYFIAALFLTAGLFVYGLWESFEQNTQKKFLVYAVPKTTAYDFIDGKNNILFSDSSLLCNDSKLQFHIKNNWWSNGLSEGTGEDIKKLPEKNSKFLNGHLFIQDNFTQFYDKRIVFISSKKQTAVVLKKKIKADYLVLSKNVAVKISEVLALFEVRHIILDSSNSEQKVCQWLAECKNAGIDCYSVLHSGAFQMVF